MKKILFIISSIIFFFSCSENENIINSTAVKKETSSRLSLDQNVKLIKAKDFKRSGCSKSGCIAYQYREFIVEVANLNFTKKVAVREQLANGTWEDIYLTYDSTTSNGTEIWKGGVSKLATYAPVVTSPFGEKFAIRYEVNGKEYWDNNSGQNYSLTNYKRGESSDFLILANDISIFSTSPYDTQMYNDGDLSYVNIAADVRNINFDKTVQVVYTTNNWVTKSTANLSYYIPLYSNDNSNFETWKASFTIPKTSQIQFALVYKVNGVEYWDNNFGKNYFVNSLFNN
jgi:hypothetical protein